MYNTSLSRRQFLQIGAASVTSLRAISPEATPTSPRNRPLEPAALKSHFPALNQTVLGKQLTYFDTAATAQKPAEVIDAVSRFYCHDNANPATNHCLAKRSLEAFEGARRIVAEFIGASDALEIVWTRGTTEAINLVASSWGEANIRGGDEIILTIAEHASNMLPWQLLAKRKGAQVRYVNVLDDGHLDLMSLKSNLNARTRLVCFSHVSNVLGIINPAAQICRMAHDAGALVLIDAAQSAPHIPIDVQQLDCDFLAFSGHKVMGPMGTGVLWVRRSILDRMPPYQAGSNMAHAISLQDWEYSEGARRFGAGTPNVSGAVGLAAALNFIRSIEHGRMWEHEQRLTNCLHAFLSRQKEVKLLGARETANRISLFCFTVDFMEAETVARKLDQYGIAVRAGDMASLPLLERFGIKRAVRASLYVYNSMADIEAFARAFAAITGKS